jgi:hypothetical protein
MLNLSKDFEKLFKLALCSLGLVMLLAVGRLHAQTATDMYHASAQKYIGEKDREAKGILDEAIRRFPDDQKLRILRGMIKEPDQPPPPQQNQQQNNQDNDENRQQNQPPQPQKQQIPPEQAEQILNALKNNEKQIQKELRKKAMSKARVEKDW